MVRGGLRHAESAATFGALLDFGDSFVPHTAIYKKSWRAGSFSLWNVCLHNGDSMCNNAEGYLHIKCDLKIKIIKLYFSHALTMSISTMDRAVCRIGHVLYTLM